MGVIIQPFVAGHRLLIMACLTELESKLYMYQQAKGILCAHSLASAIYLHDLVTTCSSPHAASSTEPDLHSNLTEGIHIKTYAHIR